MIESSELYDAFTIRDEIGMLADAVVSDEKYLKAVRSAMEGPCQTSDQGLRLFVVSLIAVNQTNVDTEELIWPIDPSTDTFGTEEIPLCVLTDKDLWLKYEAHWKENDPVAWTAFFWRIAVPLTDKLAILPPW
ncbi:hypothetical protein LFX25_04945 [Leptospira sp. FAT2]|uniref:hypothetical protein n=1 Tax=Leptospira sanjuanensis TaxID=2879643 RepID=UPI001EE7832F|nr:hypothetical protein [Leptospira sanjuanensis]MCG6192583.1 hypothetical protein [Leptospira sanjuanensis]